MRDRGWMRWLFLVTGLAAAPACGGEEGAPPEDEEEPPIVCGEFEVKAEDGTCHGIGVPPGQCAPGFVSDQLGGCVAVLPPAPCPPGRMALPGEEICREVAPCGEGPWGDIPVDATTQYVDASFVGASDGSAAAPWTTIASALSVVAPGGMIAVAEGVYSENVALTGKPVRLWGRCPDLVTIAGTDSLATVQVATGADGTELHNLSITSVSNGVFVSGSSVLFQGIWLHDMPGRGLNFQNSYGPTTVTLSDSLIELVTGIGIFQGAATGVVERSVVRDIIPQPDGRAAAFGSEANPQDLSRPATTITSSLFERLSVVGLNLGSADVVLQDSLVRDVTSPPGGQFGMGVSLYESLPDLGGTAQIRGVVVEGTRYLGILALGTQATLERVVLRDVATREDGTFGDGLAVVAEGIPSAANIVDSRVERVGRAGVSTFGATSALTRSSVACAAFPLNYETHLEQPGVVNDGGGNVCGCDQLDVCQAVSSNLEPPIPLP